MTGVTGALTISYPWPSLEPWASQFFDSLDAKAQEQHFSLVLILQVLIFLQDAKGLQRCRAATL